MEIRVYAGNNRCEWVRMGQYGCDCVPRAAGATETTHKHAKMVMQPLIRAVWPGKFPQTSCFAKKNSKWDIQECRWVQMGFYGRFRVYFDGGAGKRGETRRKLTLRDIFVRYNKGGGGECKKSIAWLQRLQMGTGGNQCKRGHAQEIPGTIANARCDRYVYQCKKTAKQGIQINVKQCFSNQKKQPDKTRNVKQKMQQNNKIHFGIHHNKQ